MPDFDALWDFSNPAGTEIRFREYEASGAEALELRTQIARTLGLQQRFAEGHVELDEVDRADSNDERVRIRSALERGRLHNSSGDRVAARRFFEMALTLAEQAREDNLAVDAAHMIAIAAPSESIEWNERALALAGESVDPKARAWRGSLLNNLGWSYHAMKDYPMALAYFEDAIAFRKEQGKADEIRVAEWCFARSAALARPDRGGALDPAAARGGGHRRRIRLRGARRAAAAPRAGDEARPKLARAYELLSKDAWLQRDEPARLDRLRRLASGDE